MHLSHTKMQRLHFFQTLYRDKMKKITFIILTILIVSCNNKMFKQPTHFKKCYKVPKFDLFGSKEICFCADSTFKFVDNAPLIIASSGAWKYNRKTHEIELTSFFSSNTSKYSVQLDTLIYNRNTHELEIVSLSSSNSSKYTKGLDTIWVDLTGKKIAIKKRGQINFEGFTYYLQGLDYESEFK